MYYRHRKSVSIIKYGLSLSAAACGWLDRHLVGILMKIFVGRWVYLVYLIDIVFTSIFEVCVSVDRTNTLNRLWWGTVRYFRYVKFCSCLGISNLFRNLFRNLFLCLFFYFVSLVSRCFFRPSPCVRRLCSKSTPDPTTNSNSNATNTRNNSSMKGAGAPQCPSIGEAWRHAAPSPLPNLLPKALPLPAPPSQSKSGGRRAGG